MALATKAEYYLLAMVAASFTTWFNDTKPNPMAQASSNPRLLMLDSINRPLQIIDLAMMPVPIAAFSSAMVKCAHSIKKNFSERWRHSQARLQRDQMTARLVDSTAFWAVWLARGTHIYFRVTLTPFTVIKRR